MTSKASANSFHELSMTSVSIDVIREFWRATKRELVYIVWIVVAQKKFNVHGLVKWNTQLATENILEMNKLWVNDQSAVNKTEKKQYQDKLNTILVKIPRPIKFFKIVFHWLFIAVIL